MTVVGTRVGALLSANKEKVELLGYGIYAGRETPPEPPAMTGFTTWEELDAYYVENQPEAVAQLKEAGNWPMRPANPKIELDSGEVVWGQECWWGPEEQIKAEVKKYEDAGVPIVEITMVEAKERIA